ncbi:MAG: Mbeg1-like protein, partial [Raoultibacter sp.]
TQFAAMTFIQKRDFAYVGFRGTDSSLTGWKEDFNMAFSWPIPSQEQAEHYLNAVAMHLPKALMVGGHSKGGNLAVFAAVKAQPRVQDRIVHVYNHDGPGFKPAAFTPDDFTTVRDRITKTVPVDSIVGMLMESRGDYHVVESTAKGIMQHDPFSWQVDGTDFVYAAAISDNAKFTDKVLSEWLGHFSDDELAVIVDAIFTAVEASGAEDATDIMSGGAKTVALLTEASKNTGEPERSILGNALLVLSEIAMRHFGHEITNLILPKAK